MSESILSPSPLHRWSIHDSAETYGIQRWGDGLFSINSAGNVTVGTQANSPQIDIKLLIDELRERGISTPLLLRFSDILKFRIDRLHQCFATAMADCAYEGRYMGVFPIKVNQAKTVIQEIVNFGKEYHYGLEAGSKAELMAILAIHQDRDSLIVCNGYKDDEYIKLALLGSTLGPTVVLVAEKPSELARIHKVSKELGIPPSYGVRAKLSTPGAGKWKKSGGDFSKFGLSATELVAAAAQLRSWGELSQLRLLHFHLGSQISAIRSIKNALREAARLYVELRCLGCTSLDYLDVGGGLGIDYDGSQTNFHSSMNYSMQEYANDVVYEVTKVCSESDIPHPTLVSESGRAIAAHHSVLIADVLEVSTSPDDTLPSIPEDASDPIIERFYEAYQQISRKNLIETYHDAAAYRDQALQLFNLGHLSLEHRVLCDRIFWAMCKKVQLLLKGAEHIPEELEGLERALCDTYFLNFSLFQSLPDAWAMDQLFPTMPIHRHNEQPTRRGILADITCDSDGCMEHFIDLRDVKHVLELHTVQPGEPYYLGFFLVGAYQEILGALHNLLGTTNTVHISLADGCVYSIETAIAGDTVSDVLGKVNYCFDDLLGSLRDKVSSAIQREQISPKTGDQLLATYESGLAAYTYLVK